VVSIGKAFGVPFFHQSGADQNLQEAIPCVCNIPAQNNDQCDIFDLLIGVLVYRGTSSAISKYATAIQPYIPVMELFYVQPVTNNTMANQKMYYGGFAGTHQTANGLPNPKYQTIYTDPQWRQSNYNWTITPDFGTASFIVWRLQSPHDQKVSSDNTQVPNGACNDPFTSPDWAKFYDHPWGKLTETYFECTSGFQDALISAVGIAGGTASLFISALFGVFVWIVMTIFSLVYVTDDSHVEKKKAVPFDMAPAELDDKDTLKENFEKISLQLEMLKAKIKELDETVM